MIQIRKATLKDVHALNALWKELMTYHDEVLLPQNPQLRPHLQKKKNAAAVFEGFLKKNIRSKNGCVFIAEDDKVAVGYCLLYIKKNIPTHMVTIICRSWIKMGNDHLETIKIGYTNLFIYILTKI